MVELISCMAQASWRRNSVNDNEADVGFPGEGLDPEAAQTDGFEDGLRLAGPVGVVQFIKRDDASARDAIPQCLKSYHRGLVQIEIEIEQRNY